MSTQKSRQHFTPDSRQLLWDTAKKINNPLKG